MLKLGEHIVVEEVKDVRCSDYLIGIHPRYATKNAVKKALKRGEIYINSVKATTAIFIKVNDHIEWYDVDLTPPKPYKLVVETLFEDDDILVVNKPAGLVVSGNQFKTLVNALAYNYTPSSAPDGWKWAKPIHRLDAQTSGILICSKNNSSHTTLAKDFENKRIKKSYIAVVHGKPQPSEGLISTSIEDQPCESSYRTLKVIPSLRHGEISLLSLSPHTGRTHQLRIHCSSNNHPIIGDKIYANEEGTVGHKGLFLCAKSIEFNHPKTGEFMRIEIETPHKFHSFIEREERRFVNYHKA